MGWLMRAIVAGTITCFLAATAFTQERASAETVIAALDKPLTIEKQLHYPLRDLLDYLTKVSGAVFVIDESAYKDLEPPVDNIGDVPTRLPNLRGQRLETALRLALAPIGGDFLVREGFVEITTQKQVSFTTNQIQFDEDGFPYARRTQLVVSFSHQKTSLAEIARSISNSTGANIIITESAVARSRTPISLRLLNVRLDQALHAAAEMAGLRTVRRENVYYVTTREHAAELERQIGGPEIVHLQRRIRNLELQSQLLVNEVIRMQRANNTIKPVEYAPAIQPERR